MYPTRTLTLYRSPMLGLFMAELGVGYYDAAIGAANDALDAGYRIYLFTRF
jgi:hypothetical protein